MLNAFLVALAVFICVGGAELVGFTMLNRPIVIGPLVGLFLGDLHTGVIIGASLEAVFMGVVNIGGASAAEPGIATAVGTAFAIMLGKGSEVALTLALPIGILGLQIKTVLYIFIVGMFAKTFDRLAAEGKEKQIVALHYGLWAVNWFLYSLFAFFGILFGSDAVSALLDAIPDVVMNGLTVCGGLLPAVGMAMLMKMLWDNKICMFYFLGFVLAAYFFRVVCAVLTATMAGYAFGRLNFKGRDLCFSLVLFQMMVPVQIFIIPQYLMVSKMGMLNTIFALVFPGIVTAFGTFLLRQGYMGLPKDLEEAARLDGCNIGQTFLYIMAPLTRSSMVALGIFTAVFAFKDLMWPMIVNTDKDMLVLSSALAKMQGQYVSKFPELMAASLIACIPMIVIYMIFQKQFIEGIATSGGKL